MTNKMDHLLLGYRSESLSLHGWFAFYFIGNPL